MAGWLHKLAASASPLVVLIALVAIDQWSQDGVSVTGMASGMAFMAALVSLYWWLARGPAAQLAALQAALRSIAEVALGVVFVFLLVAPLTALLPHAWVVALMHDDQATDFLVLMLLGMGIFVAAHALRRADRQAAVAARFERDAAMARAELAERERELSRAELQALRAQVEPHFLWNTLANVEYLIRKDTSRAQVMMGHLIAYLRSSVPDSRAGSSTLGREFESVRAYLGLIQFRMGERLQSELVLAPECADVEFPPLVLQTLVENAIKHGLEPLVGPARLQVRAQPSVTDRDRLVVEIVDNGVGLQAQPRTRGTGLGLRNVRERLQALQGHRASLAISGNPDTAGVCARIEWAMK